MHLLNGWTWYITLSWFVVIIIRSKYIVSDIDMETIESNNYKDSLRDDEVC